MLLLASSSPRRIGLLKTAGYTFDTFSPDVDERRKAGESPKSMVKRLSLEKAQVGLLRHLEQSHLTVLAADTIVVDSKQTVLGKPKDKGDAARILGRISGKMHWVHTGFTVLNAQRAITQVISTRVFIRALSKKEIQSYIESGEPMDKAGAYAAQGQGMIFIQKIIGSYTNVIGLPMCESMRVLSQFRVSPT